METKYRLTYDIGGWVEHRDLPEILALRDQPGGAGTIEIIEMVHTVTNDPSGTQYESADAADHAARTLSEDTFRRVTTETVVGTVD